MPKDRSGGDSLSPRNPRDLKVDTTFVSKDVRSLHSPHVGMVRHSPPTPNIDKMSIQVNRKVRSRGIMASKIGDLPALIINVAKVVQQTIIGNMWAELRKATGARVIREIVEKDLVGLAAQEQHTVALVLRDIVPEAIDAPLTEATLHQLHTNHKKRSPSIPPANSDSDTISSITRKSPPSKLPTMQKSMRRTASLADAMRLKIETPDCKSHSPSSRLKIMVENGEDDPFSANKHTGTNKSKNRTLEIVGARETEGASKKTYMGLQHNPYIGTVQHAPSIEIQEDSDIVEKVYETALRCSWAPLKDPHVADIIPLAARILQLVMFESQTGRHGHVDDEAVSIEVINKLVNEAIPWKTDDDSRRAKELMERTVPEAIASRLTLDTIEAIVALSEKQVVRRQLEENIPYMAVMGLDNRVTAEGDCVETSRAHRIERMIFTIDLLYSAMLSLIPMFLVGYNTAVMNSAEVVVFPGHSTLSWSLAVSIFAIGGPFGALAGGMIANIYGRKAALQLDMAVFFVGGLCLTAAFDMIAIIVARFLIGFASGFATVLVPIYMGELSPPALRGTFGTMSQLSMVIGILAAAILSLWCTTEDGWRYMFGVTALLPLLSLYSLQQVKESPRWLYSHSKLSAAAKRLETAKLLMELRGFRDENETAAELAIFEDAIKKQKTHHRSAHALGAMSELLFDHELRPLVICTLVLQMSQQFCGINAVFYYSTRFLSGAVSDPLVGTCLISAVNVFATYLAAKIMDKYPRKALLLFSAVGMFVSCIGITFALAPELGLPGGQQVSSALALISTAAYVTMFELGLGPIPWLISSEMFDVKNVATAQSIASQMNWGCNFAVGLGFPYMQERLGGYTFIPFAIVLLLSSIFVVIYVPETAGETSEEVLEKTMSQGNLREFRRRKRSARASEAKRLLDSRENLNTSPMGSAAIGGSYGSFKSMDSIRNRNRRKSSIAMKRKESFQNLFYNLNPVN